MKGLFKEEGDEWSEIVAAMAVDAQNKENKSICGNNR
jgi:hypothetical protein